MKSVSYFIDSCLYELIMLYLVFIVVFVIVGLVYILLAESVSLYYSQGSVLEFLWTVLPLGVLFSIALPSMKYLYVLESGPSSSILVKVVGNQWYWVYSYADLEFSVESYMLPYSELSEGSFSLLEVGSPCVVPFGVVIQFLIGSGDVLHSWAVPSLGVKVDAIPGSVSSSSVWLKYPGLYVGMCSEFCGAYHSYMPIGVEAVSPLLFLGWVDGQ